MAAIYCPPWPLEVTTTPYPVEVFDKIELTISFDDGYMGELPHSEATIDFGSTGGSWSQERWFSSDGPYDSDGTIDFDSPGGRWLQVRWFYEDGPYDSNATIGFGAVDGLWKNKLVVADTGSTNKPYEELQLNIAISPDCAMELI